MKKILLCTLLFSFHVVASDCETMNLITEENSPYNDIPVQDQDGSGTCYAHTAAQMLNYNLIKSGQTQRVHPMWAALRYAQRKKLNTVYSGLEAEAMKAVIEANCSQDLITKNLMEYATKANVSEANIMAVIDTFAENLRKYGRDKKSEDPESELSEVDIQLALVNAVESHKAFCAYNSTWDDLLPVIRTLKSFSSPEMFSKLLMPSCQNPEALSDVGKPKIKRLRKDKDVSPEIQKSLNRLQSPVALSYCSDVLKNPEFDVGKRSFMGGFKNDCAVHISTIVGKKKIENSCHFLLRNTWGAGFGAHNEKFSCLCKDKETGAFVDDCRSETHNNGKYSVEGCWISEDLLAKNSWELSYLDTGKEKKGFFQKLFGK